VQEVKDSEMVKPITRMYINFFIVFSFRNFRMSEVDDYLGSEPEPPPLKCVEGFTSSSVQAENVREAARVSKRM